jgi:histidine triad (HIT) family protein
MTDACQFCRIASREVTAHAVHEDEQLFAFLDIHPIRPAHALIIPKRHFPYFDDMPAALAASIIAVGQRLAVAMKRIYGIERVAFLFAGDDIAHAHAHVIPMHERTDITSRHYIAERKLTFREAPRASDDELRAIATQLVDALRSQAA